MFLCLEVWLIFLIRLVQNVGDLKTVADTLRPRCRRSDFGSSHHFNIARFETDMEAPIHRVIKATSSLSVRHQPRHAARCIVPCRYLHTTSEREATPVAHPTVVGPPPQPPQNAATSSVERVARKRQQAEAFRQNQQAKTNPAKPTSALQKRFWKNVHVKEDSETGNLEVYLDTRPVRTPSRTVLSLPRSKRALATGIALEWDQLVSAQQALKHHYIPLTSLASRALDIQNADVQQTPEENTIRQSIVKLAMRYLGTDTLLCWAPMKNIHDPDSNRKPLRQRQKEVAEPIIAYLTTHIFPGVEVVPILGEDSIVPMSQPEMTREVIRGWVSGLPAFELAALERGIIATKSLLVAARLVVEWSTEFAHLQEKQRARSEDGLIEIEPDRFDIEKAAEAANLEVLHQTEQWGEVEDTHDVDKEDLRRQLGSVILLVT